MKRHTIAAMPYNDLGEDINMREVAEIEENYPLFTDAKENMGQTNVISILAVCRVMVMQK